MPHNINTKNGFFHRAKVSLMGNAIKSVLVFVIGILLARWLNPVDYGRYLFLIATFGAFRQFLDMGTATAFYSLLSQKHRNLAFINLYWIWTGVQLLCSFLVLSLLLPEEFVNAIFIGEDKELLFIALLAVFMQQHFWVMASQMAEACRETGKIQFLSVISNITILCAIILFWFLDALTVEIVFLMYVCVWGLSGVVAARLYKPSLDKAPLFPQVQELWNYTKHLIPFFWLSAGVDLFDRWAIQHWAGSEEQAFFGVAMQFSAVSVFVTTSIIKVYWKEVAEARQNKNFEAIGALFDKASTAVLFVGAIVASLIIPWSEEILDILLGTKYVAGNVAFIIMMIYSIHQGFAQIIGTTLHASGDVKRFSMSNNAMMIVGIIFSYMIMSPIAGFELGSAGISYKYLLIQWLQVYFMAYWLKKAINIRFGLACQLFVGALLVIGICVKYVSGMLLSDMAYKVPVFMLLHFSISYVLYINVFPTGFLSLGKAPFR